MTAPFTNLTIATAAIVSPFWLDWLTKVSSGAGLLLPIAGLLLALLQIVRLLKDWKNTP
jgi:hypothetical protein